MDPLLVVIGLVVELLNTILLFKLFRDTSIYMFFVAGLGCLFHIFYGVFILNIITINPLEYLLLSNLTLALLGLGVTKILSTYLDNNKPKYFYVSYTLLLLITGFMLLTDMTIVYPLMEVSLTLIIIIYYAYLNNSKYGCRVNPFKYCRR